MAQLTKQALIVENNQSFPNNNTGAITPTILRNFNTDVIDSTVNQTAYDATIGGIENSIDSLNSFTASFNTDITGSSLITASAAGATITFTKGNGSQFDVTVTATADSVAWDNVTGKPSGLVSGSSQVVDILTSVNSFTASQETKDTTLAAYTGSVNTQLTNLSTSQSIDNTKWNTIGSQSGSWVTESETGSFARTNVTNTFTADQIIQGGLNVTGTITANEIHTIIESSSVIYSSGSNQFGDTSSDVQTLYGSVRVINQLTASGLNYPTTDNGVKSFIQTDGNGNLSLQYVDAMYETVRNMSGGTLLKGTPVYISGSTGDNGNAYPADASDASKMPAVYILGEDLNINEVGIALIGGEISGVNTTGYPAGTIIYTAEGGGWSSSRPSGSNSIVQVLGVVQFEGVGGQGVVINQLEATLPNLQTGYAWVGNGTNQPIAVATSSFQGSTIDTGSFATTGSNVFNGAQTILNGGINLQSNIEGSGSAYTGVTAIVDVTSDPTNVYSAFQLIKPGGDSLIAIAANSYTPQYPGVTIPMLFGGGNNPDGNNAGIAFPTDGTAEVWKKTNFKYGVDITGSLNVSSTITASLQEGYAWVGGSGNETIAVPTSSFGGGGTIVGYATTGSNTFNGDQNIIGSITASAGILSNNNINVVGNNNGIELKSNAEGSGSAYASVTVKVDATTDPTNVYSSLQLVEQSGNTLIALAANSYTGEYPGITIPYLFGGGNNPGGTNAGIAFPTDGRMDVWKQTSFKYGLDITGSVKLTPASVSTNASYPITFVSGSTISKDSVDTLVYNPSTNQLLLSASTGQSQITANSVGFTSGSGAYGTYASTMSKNGFVSSVEGSGYISMQGNPSKSGAPSLTTSTKPGILALSSSAQPYVAIELQNSSSFTDGRVTIKRPLIAEQNVEITGSLSVSGSINTSVIPLAITSNTASLNASTGNTFQLNLVASTDTRLEISNAKSGQTLNLLVSQSAAGAGTMTFGTGIVQPSGSFYSASQVASAEDILTFATFVNPSKIYVANIKNLI